MVFIVAGEASGDWAGARLACALRQREPKLSLEGVGGRRMAAAGVELVADSSDWGAIGVCDAVKKIPRVWRALKEVKAKLEQQQPSGLVLIDSGGVNVPLARMVSKLGIRMLYYLPPGSWSRTLRNPGLRELVDVIATPFPWSQELLIGGRARVEWVGHPVLEAARPKLSPEEAWKHYALDPTRPVVALAPGSREQEMKHVLPLLAEAAGRLARDMGGVQFISPVSDPSYEKRGWDTFQKAGVNVTLLQGMEYDALQLATAAAVCSGTATLEFACLGVPMIIVYRAGLGTSMQFVLIRGVIGKQWRAGMPNIIAGRDIVPELLWKWAKPEALARELGSLLSDESRRNQMKTDLAEVVANLGNDPRLGGVSASERTAELVLELIGQERGV